jgi:hypothetical protein
MNWDDRLNTFREILVNESSADAVRLDLYKSEQELGKELHHQ